jgi:hypothetical protein
LIFLHLAFAHKEGHAVFVFLSPAYFT